MTVMASTTDAFMYIIHVCNLMCFICPNKLVLALWICAKLAILLNFPINSFSNNIAI